MQSSTPKHKAFAIVLAALAWGGVLLQCYLSLRLSADNGNSIGAGLGNFLSYFTVVTNLLICVSLTASLIGPSSALGQWFSRPFIVTCIAVSIAFVGLSYHLLLRNTWNPKSAQLVADTVLHYAVPVIYVIYWWFESATPILRWRHPLAWSIYPTVYLIYALIRGSVAGSYPYPFIDVAHLGYGRTVLNSFCLLFAFIAMGFVFVALGRARHERT
jgi:hypothetical protein